ncbi:MAG: ATP-binding protein [Chitinophagaceae bacterium]
MNHTNKDLQSEIDGLRLQLEEANDTIEAIRSGQVDALVVMGSDRHHLFTLKSADETYRVVIENMNEAAITLNRDGIILYSNNSFARMVNTPLSKVVGLSFIDYVASAQQAKIADILTSAWLEDAKGEVLLRKGQGGYTPVLFSINALDLDGGMALSVILTDLSRQKEGEWLLEQKNTALENAKSAVQILYDELEEKVNQRTRELLISREHFRFLADNIPVIAWTATPNGMINYCNKRWYDLTQMQEGIDFFDQWAEMIHPDERTLAIKTWEKSIATGLPYRMEYKIKNGNDGSYLWHFGHALPYKNESGEVVAWFGTATDIDFQKKALEQKDEFISMVSHELKTPVTSLKGYTQLAELVLDKEKEPQVYDYLTRMNTQIGKLTRLIGDLLQVTAFNNGLLQFDEDHFDLNALVGEVVAEMRLSTDRHRIDWKSPGPVIIYGDRDRIGQVISNIISNAIKYSPNADQIVVSSFFKDGEIVFYVQDFGIGISREQQEKLFTRFYRVPRIMGNTFPGLGLGLYISSAIIEKHHGRMWVESDENSGATFYFSLPLV